MGTEAAVRRSALVAAEPAPAWPGPGTVTSVEQAPPGSCTIEPPFSIPSTKLVLTSADQHWTVYLNIPGFPTNAINVGDTFDLAINARSVFWYGPEQLITLSKSGKLVVFGYSGFQRPDLSAFG
ncbi:MAG TPA: hypothetical protein VGD55_04595, partial [Acidothermaceae bacterium]